MIAKERIIELVNEKLGTDQFLVEVTVSSSNVIHVMIDSEELISISQIVELSRHIESGLDRDVEDFELSVFSAGLTEPFKLVRQYKKNLGKEIEVLLMSGKKLTGILTKASDENIELEVMTKIKPVGSKKNELVLEVHQIVYSDIKEAKKIIKF